MEISVIVPLAIDLPDIFSVLARVWGINILCVCLIPLFFSMTVLTVALFSTIRSAINSRPRREILLWSAVAAGIGALFLLQAIRWFSLAGIGADNFAHLHTSAILLLPEAALMALILLAAYRLFPAPTIRTGTFILSLIYSEIALFILLGISDINQYGELLPVLAETLLLTGFGSLAVSVQGVPNQILSL